MKRSRIETLSLRGRRASVRVWGDHGARQLFMLHGRMDGAATFQFLVDALEQDWQVIAPDWRGFGGSEGNAGPYYFPDYLADLDALLRHYAADQPILLLGHSMGANIAGLYAGARTERVEKLVLVEGVGLPPTDPSEAPLRYRRWLDQLLLPQRMSEYASVGELAARLREKNPRLTPERAEFLAAQLHLATPAGGVSFAADPWHRVVNPVLYRVEETMACWRAITAPALWVMGSESHIMRRFDGCEEKYRERVACLRDVREVSIAESGHNVHHDQPERLARAVEEFLAA